MIELFKDMNILQLATTIGIGIISYFVKDLKRSIDKVEQTASKAHHAMIELNGSLKVATQFSEHNRESIHNNRDWIKKNENKIHSVENKIHDLGNEVQKVEVTNAKLDIILRKLDSEGK